jgi:hypothetical protein
VNTFCSPPDESSARLATPEGVLVSRLDIEHAVPSQDDGVVCSSLHDAGDGSPASRMAEHAISNNQILDGSIAVFSENQRASGKAGESAVDEVDIAG